MEIGKKIRELRMRKGLTQEELANRSELSKGFISQLENDVTSPSIATLMDGDTGRVLFGKRETDPMAMASTTKIMTCILALENGGEQAVATASAQAAAAPKKLGN